MYAHTSLWRQLRDCSGNLSCRSMFLIINCRGCWFGIVWVAKWRVSVSIKGLKNVSNNKNSSMRILTLSSQNRCSRWLCFGMAVRNGDRRFHGALNASPSDRTSSQENDCFFTTGGQTPKMLTLYHCQTWLRLIVCISTAAIENAWTSDTRCRWSWIGSAQKHC